MQNLEKEIVNILSDADPAELNYMLPKIGLGLLFYKVKDHFPTNLNRTRLLDLVAVTRISVRHIFFVECGEIYSYAALMLCGNVRGYVVIPR